MEKIWDKQENIILQDGKIYTPEALFANPNWAWTKYAKTVIIDKVDAITIGIYNLAILAKDYDVDTENLSSEEAFELYLQRREQRKQEMEQAMRQPTAEERIAAMLEYQVLSEM